MARYWMWLAEAVAMRGCFWSGTSRWLRSTGSYQIAFIASIGLGLFAAIVNLPVNETPLTERKGIPAAA